MNASILNALGAGSGIDTTKLVADLTAAQRQPRQSALDARAATAGVQLSRLASLASGVTTVADAARSRARSLVDADLPTYVEDLVAALNSIRTELNQSVQVVAGGIGSAPLSGDSGARALSRAMSSLAGAVVPGSTLRLTDIGISTARDGTLALDDAKLAAALASDPAAVKTLLGIGSPVASGFNATLQQLKLTMTGTQGMLTRSKAIYDRITGSVARDTERLDREIATLTDRLTKSYAAMDKAVGAIKASQAYLTQQVDAWYAKS